MRHQFCKAQKCPYRVAFSRFYLIDKVTSSDSGHDERQLETIALRWRDDQAGLIEGIFVDIYVPVSGGRSYNTGDM
jgi:hypothetical protein